MKNLFEIIIHIICLINLKKCLIIYKYLRILKMFILGFVAKSQLLLTSKKIILLSTKIKELVIFLKSDKNIIFFWKLLA